MGTFFVSSSAYHSGHSSYLYFCPRSNAAFVYYFFVMSLLHNLFQLYSKSNPKHPIKSLTSLNSKISSKVNGINIQKYRLPISSVLPRSFCQKNSILIQMKGSLLNYYKNLKTNSMSFSKICSFQRHSRRSSDSDSSSQSNEECCYSKTNVAKHKTELCKTFEELGSCPYENKCRFAHGRRELVRLPPSNACKSRKCNGFWKNGCCSYGVRCQFGHAEIKWEDSAILLGLEAACSQRVPKHSKLMRLLN